VVKAVQEQQAMIQDLQTQIEGLKAKCNKFYSE
jgi:hypothetical protein